MKLICVDEFYVTALLPALSRFLTSFAVLKSQFGSKRNGIFYVMAFPWMGQSFVADGRCRMDEYHELESFFGYFNARVAE